MKIGSETVIVLTGASSGVGKAIASALALYRPHLVLAARRQAALEQTAEECRELGATVHCVVADMKNQQDIELLARGAAAINGKIDIWINNAGVLAAGALEDVPAETNEAVIRINALGYIHGAQQAVKYFKQQEYGILINNISIGGWLPTPYATAYSASKFAVRGFSEALKGELSHFPDIHVVDLMPWLLDTHGMQHAANFTGKVLQPGPLVNDALEVARAVVALIARPMPLKRIGWPTVALQAGHALFPKLMRNITGQIMRTYFNHADSMPPGSGNLLSPAEYGTSISGGWGSRPGVSTRWMPAALISAALLAAVLVRKTSR